MIDMRQLFALVFIAIGLSQDVDLNVPGYECSDCHGSDGWEMLTLRGFSHEQTSFPLKGIHRSQDCTSCHSGSTVQEKHMFAGVSSSCTSCHMDVHESQLGSDCEQCHDIKSWQVTSQSFDHNDTQFSLQGPHKTVPCNDCHTETPMIQFRQVEKSCYGCHYRDYNRVETPSHILARLDRDCTLCHSVRNNDWSPSSFRHEDYYVLTGAHIVADCFQCHNGIFAGTETTCSECHSADFQATGTNAYPESPNHVDSEYYSIGCEGCHSTSNWNETSFQHSETGYVLTGAHQSTDCYQCHELSGYDLETTCQYCHQPNSIALTTVLDSDFDHNGHNLSDDCEQCHTEVSWEQTLFHHSDYTDQDCESCHILEHTESTEPPHAPDNIRTDCFTCHESTEDWDIPGFQHLDEQTNYSLIGLHILTDCNLCHVENVYRSTPTSCEASQCHLNHFTETTEPDHNARGYSPEYCLYCHDPFGWIPSIFDHNFSIGCVSCHLSDYQQVENPDHVAKEYSQVCTLCHLSTEDWLDVQIDHSNYTDPCISCHSMDYNQAETPNHETNNFNDDCTMCHTSTTVWRIDEYNHEQTISCFTCHESDYTDAANPNHDENQFTTECTLCHGSTESWVISSFNHDQFSYACNQCHLPDYFSTSNPSHLENNYSTDCIICHNSTSDWYDVTFDHSTTSQACIVCHSVDFESAGNPDHDNQGYPEDCTNCHNTENWTDDFFAHGFPIFTGDHANEWSTCIAECHVNPTDYSEFSCGLNGVCHEHRQSEMDDEHDDEPGYVYESWACYDCHPNGESEGLNRRHPKNQDWKSILDNDPLKW